MTHAPETGAINRLHFWHLLLVYGLYVCRANLGPDSFGIRFRRLLQHWRARDSNDDMWLVNDNRWRYEVVVCIQLYCYLFMCLTFSAMSVCGSWKFSFETHRERKTMPNTGTGKWSRYTAPVSGTCVMGLTW